MRIDPSKIEKWNIASKAKSIKAKPLITLLVDRTVTNKFLIDTLEGKEPLDNDRGVVICVGEAGDVWQQTPMKLLQKYDVKAIDSDGWMICEPKPDNAVNCVEITQELANSFSDKSHGAYYILGNYGEKYEDGLRQKCVVGDFICQNRTDPNDNWIVARKIFMNTYIIKS